jgi:DNA repair protein RadC
MGEMMIKEMPESEQPRYRIEAVGPRAMSSTELLTLCWSFSHTDPPEQLLAKAGSLTKLANMTVEEMSEVKGVGEVAAKSIKAALELGRRLSMELGGERPQFRSPADIAAFVLPQLCDAEQEHLVILSLDTKNRLISADTVYVGNVNTAIVRIAELFRPAIRHNATTIIVVHNHPSGDVTPSPEDVRMTENIVKSGKMMELGVLDHLVIGKGRWLSMRERRLGFE